MKWGDMPILPETAARRRTKLRELLRDMPIEDVALVIYDQTFEWLDALEKACVKIEDEEGPQDDDHLNWHGQSYSPPTDEVM